MALLMHTRPEGIVGARSHEVLPLNSTLTRTSSMPEICALEEQAKKMLIPNALLFEERAQNVRLAQGQVYAASTTASVRRRSDTLELPNNYPLDPSCK